MSEQSLGQKGTSGEALVRMQGWSLACYALLAAALTVSDGHDQPLAEVLLLASTACVTMAVLRTGPAATWPSAPWSVFAVAMASALTTLLHSPGGITTRLRGDSMYFAVAGIMTCLVATYATDVKAGTLGAGGWRAWRPLGLLGLGTALGIWMMRASPAPDIDVWGAQQQAAVRLLHGQSVYAPGAIAIVDSHSFARVIVNYAYPPLNVLLAAGGYALTGDTRFSSLAAIIAGAWLLRATARHGEKVPTAVPDLLMACLLVHPRGLFVIDQAWGEPLAIPFLGGFTLACLAKKPVFASVLLGFACAVKQHLLLYVPLLAFVPGIGLRGALVALATAGGTYVPFLLWDPGGMWSGLVEHHLGNPFRADSLSLTALLSNAGILLPAWFGFAVALPTFAIVPRVPRQLGALLIASTLPFFAFYVFGRQAFCNYYYLINATLLFGIAANRGKTDNSELRAPETTPHRHPEDRSDDEMHDGSRERNPA